MKTRALWMQKKDVLEEYRAYTKRIIQGYLIQRSKWRSLSTRHSLLLLVIGSS